MVKEKDLVDLMDVASITLKIPENKILEVLERGFSLTFKHMSEPSQNRQFSLTKSKNAISLKEKENGSWVEKQLPDVMSSWGHRETAYFKKFFMNALAKIGEEQKEVVVVKKKPSKPKKR